MKSWYYMVSDEPYKKYDFDSYEDTQFAILCVFRYKAPTNEVPDYTIYHNGKQVETMFGNDLFQMYVDNGGFVFEDRMNKKSIQKESNDETDSLCQAIRDATDSLKGLLDRIEKLNKLL